MLVLLLSCKSTTEALPCLVSLPLRLPRPSSKMSPVLEHVAK